MQLVRLVREIPAPIDRVWDIVRDFGRVDRWLPELSSTLEGSGAGAVRSITNPDGRVARERLELCDDAARRISYSMVTAGVFALEDVRMTIEILPAEGEDSTLVSWGVTAARDDSVDVSEPLSAWLVRIAARIDRLREAALRTT